MSANNFKDDFYLINDDDIEKISNVKTFQLMKIGYIYLYKKFGFQIDDQYAKLATQVSWYRMYLNL